MVGALIALLAFLLLMTGVAPLVRGESLAGEKAKLLSGAVSSVISIITLYVGAKIQESRDRIRSKNMYRKNDDHENKKD